ncbi:MAG: HAD family phosphatase [Planctomycetes bacterium]|nr:HAD family phosphatase [Planctomycetota bacterium]
MPGITTVVFDIGRVLVGISALGKQFGRLMRSLAIAPECAFSEFWNRPEAIAHATGRLSPAEFHRLLCKRFGIDLDYRQFAASWCDIFVSVPEMESLFSRVAECRRVGLLSDTDPLHWERLRTFVPALARVEKPTLSFEVGQLKPHPAMYRAAVENAGCPAEECLFIDDLAANILGAERFGMRAILFEGVEKLEAELRKSGILRP